MPTVVVPGEPLFPVYRWRIRCMIPQCDFTSEYVDHYDREDCMVGWEWYESGNTRMLRSPAEFDPQRFTAGIIDTMIKKHGSIHVPEVSFDPEPEWKTWHLTWFCHETYAPFKSDIEALESFERYVSAVEQYNWENACVKTLKDGTRYWDDSPVCLMGAEDRWRWRGEKDDNPPPCKCKWCVETGITRINH